MNCMFVFIRSCCYPLTLLLIAGCAEKQPAIQYSRLLPGHYLKPVDTLVFHSTESVFVTRTAQITSWREHILISDFYENKVWVFDTLMNFQRFVGGKGSGPGEFSSFPTIVPADSFLWLMDHSSMRASQYDGEFRLLQTKTFPSGFLFRRQAVFRTNRFIAAMHPARLLKAAEDLRHESVFTVLDTNFRVLARLGSWDIQYFDNSVAAKTYGYHNADVLLTGGWDGGLFVLQKAVHWVTYFTAELHELKKFGRLPAKWKEPPSIPYEQTAYSPEMISNYMGSTTQFLTLDCDTTYRRVFVNYVNLDSTVFFQRTMLAGKHYMQVYNDQFDCIFDGEIPGKLAFVRNGYIYVLTDEKPEFLRLSVYVLSG